MEGTTTLKQCPSCGNYTMEESGECHYAYCDEQGVDDMEGEREFMCSEGRNRDLTEDERYIYGI